MVRTMSGPDSPAQRRKAMPGQVCRIVPLFPSREACRPCTCHNCARPTPGLGRRVHVPARLCTSDRDIDRIVADPETADNFQLLPAGDDVGRDSFKHDHGPVGIDNPFSSARCLGGPGNSWVRNTGSMSKRAWRRAIASSLRPRQKANLGIARRSLSHCWDG